MLTIGQLAARVGVTVRAVRHYHQRGLVPEPDRDASGYRRYGPRAVVDLIRIKTRVAAGVPLARVERLLAAGQDEFAAAIAEIDRRMAAQVAELEDHRARLAELVAGDRLFLPPEVIELLDRKHPRPHRAQRLHRGRPPRHGAVHDVLGTERARPSDREAGQ